jgi:hypothetical protein
VREGFLRCHLEFQDVLHIPTKFASHYDAKPAEITEQTTNIHPKYD